MVDRIRETSLMAGSARCRLGSPQYTPQRPQPPAPTPSSDRSASSAEWNQGTLRISTCPVLSVEVWLACSANAAARELIVAEPLGSASGLSGVGTAAIWGMSGMV